MRARTSAFRPRCEPLERREVPTAGMPDPSFSGDGVAVTQVGLTHSQAKDIAVQPDNKVVVAGSAYFASANGMDIAVVRYRPDGTLDPTFGSGGIASTNAQKSGSDTANAVAVQSDGKIVVGGHSATAGNSAWQNKSVLVRYNANGTVDTTFGGTAKGVIVTDVFATSKNAQFSDYEEIHDVAVRTDGKIVAVGSYQGASFVLRYNANGTRDTTFDGDGLATLAGHTLQSVALLPDGRFLTSGSAVVRFNTDGSLDPTFGTGGVVSSVKGKGLAVAADGKVVAGGVYPGTQIEGHNGARVSRLNSDGSPDTTFGGDRNGDGVPDGYYQIENARIFGLAIDANGRVVAAGEFFPGPDTADRDLAVFRFTTSGQPDSTFGTGGMTRTDVNGSDQERFLGVAIQADGGIVTAGFSIDPVTGRTFTVLARYLGDDPLVP